MNPAEAFAQFLEQTSEKLAEWTIFRTDVAKLMTLATRCRQPFNLTVVGRMKAGKSSLINSLIGQPLTVIGVEEATATINMICYGDSTQTGHFTVHKIDGSSQSLPLDRKCEFSGKDKETLERIRGISHLEFFASHEYLKRVRIVDTPGTGSAVDEHETLTQKFLDPTKIEASVAEGNKASAIIYVVTSSARESDKEALENFQRGRLRCSGPYNSVGVLHKWDYLEESDPAASARDKAEGLAVQWKDMVSVVIPVSGPIGLAAKTFDDSFFSDLVTFLDSVNVEELEELLLTPEDWSGDANRQRLRDRDSYPLPWVSFTIICRQLKSNGVNSVVSARDLLLKYSGIDELHRILESKVFSRLRIIEAMSVLQQTSSVVTPLLLRTKDILEQKKKSLRIVRSDLCGKSPEGKRWIERIDKEMSFEIEKLDKLYEELEDRWSSQYDQLEMLSKDLKVMDTLEERPKLFPDKDREIIRVLCNFLADISQRSHMGSDAPVSFDCLNDLNDRYNSKAVLSVLKEDREIYSHIVDRLAEIMKIYQ